MTVLTLKAVSLSYRGRSLLADCDLVLGRGDKAGLVGRNGSGKTTLLKVIAGVVEPDGGARILSGVRSIGLLTQDMDLPREEGGEATALETASRGQVRIRELERELDRLAAAVGAAGEGERLDRLVRRQAALEEEFRLLGGYMGSSRVESVLAGLGFPKDRLAVPPSKLSGGEARRLEIARVLLGGHDMLLLDEPGNHLDMAGREWLARFLRDYTGTLVLVSHDRHLLNAAADRILELEGGRIFATRGDYDAHAARRVERAAEAKKRWEERRELIRKEKELIRRIHYGRKARQAKSRRKKLERLNRREPLAPPPASPSARIRFAAARPSGGVVLAAEGLAAEAGGRLLFADLDFTLERGCVLGVVGPNGSGKSTFLKMILGRLPPTGGKVSLSPTAKPAYFDQNLEELDGAGTVLDELRRVEPEAPEGALKSHLGPFLLGGDEADKKVRDLSGGEKSRLLLARIALTPSNLLVLDEPTNHLDIHTRESLEEALGAYPGTVIIVTHDRLLLDRTATRVLLLDGPGTRLLHGGLGDLPGPAGTSGPIPGAGEGKKRKKPGAAEKRAGRKDPHDGKASRVKRRHTFEDLEKLIIAKEARLEEIEGDFYKEEVYSEAGRFAELEKEARTIRAELEELYREWDTWT